MDLSDSGVLFNLIIFSLIIKNNLIFTRLIFVFARIVLSDEPNSELFRII